MFELRYYQEEALEAIRLNEADGVRRQLLVLPTGSGKTVIFAHLPTQEDRLPMLVLAHREELLGQAKAKIESINPTLSVAIEQGQNYAGRTDVVVASVPTLGRAGSSRLSEYGEGYFKTVVVDEAHHAAATTYRRVLDYFHDALRIGVTATPRRGDNVGLSEVFDDIVYAKSLEEMIREGFLVELVGYRFTSEVDLSDVKIVRGDYAEGDLAKAVNTEGRNEAVVDAYRRYGEGGKRKNLVFCVNVQHAQDVADHFRDNGIEAWAVYGAMPHAERKYLLEAHDRGDFKVLTNCMIATEGYDSPSIDMITMARPTQSTSLYAQAVGRGTRLFEGKTDCVVVDVADISRTRRPVGLPSLLGLPGDFDMKGAPVTEAADKFRKLVEASPSVALTVKSLDEIDGGWEKINLFTPPPPNPMLLEYSTLIWMELGEDHYILNFGENDSIHIGADALGMWHVRTPGGQRTEVAELSSSVFKLTNETIVVVEPEVMEFSDMADAFRYADGWAKANRKDKTVLYDAGAKWRNNPPTDKQIKVLQRAGIPHEHLDRGQASQMIDKIMADRKPRPAWLERKIQADKLKSRKF